jgi:hypothetical protein
MQLLAPIENIRFDIEDVLEKQVSIVPLPFDGMDSKPNRILFIPCETHFFQVFFLNFILKSRHRLFANRT